MGVSGVGGPWHRGGLLSITNPGGSSVATRAGPLSPPGAGGDAGASSPQAAHGLSPQRPAKRSKCRQLFRSPSMPSSVIRPILKRLERRPPDGDTPSPVKPKRRRSVAGTPGEDAEPVGDGDAGAGVPAHAAALPVTRGGRGL